MISASMQTAGAQAIPGTLGPIAPADSNSTVPDFLGMIGLLLDIPEQIQIPSNGKGGSDVAADRQDAPTRSKTEEKEQKQTPLPDPSTYICPQTISHPPPVLLFQALDFSMKRNAEGDAPPPASSGDRAAASAGAATASGPESSQQPPLEVPTLAFRLKIFGIEPNTAPFTVAAGQPVSPATASTPVAVSTCLPPAAANQTRPNDSREPAIPVSAPDPTPLAPEPTPVSAVNRQGQSSNSDSRHSRSPKQDDSPADSPSPAVDSVAATRFDIRGIETESLLAPRRHAAIPSESMQIHPVDTPSSPKPRAEPLRELSLRLPDTNQGKVNVHIVNQAGRIQVDVRASDAGLAQSLRTNVDDLVTQLHDRGYRAETDPLNGIGGAAALDGSGQGLQQDPGRHAEHEAGGGRHPQNPQQQQDQQRRRQSPTWFQYFYETDNPLAGRPL